MLHTMVSTNFKWKFFYLINEYNMNQDIVNFVVHFHENHEVCQWNVSDLLVICQWSGSDLSAMLGPNINNWLLDNKLPWVNVGCVSVMYQPPNRHHTQLIVGHQSTNNRWKCQPRPRSRHQLIHHWTPPHKTQCLGNKPYLNPDSKGGSMIFCQR